MLTLISIPWCHVLLPSILFLIWDYLFTSLLFAGLKDVPHSWDRGGAVSTLEDQCSNWQLSQFLISSFSGQQNQKWRKDSSSQLRGSSKDFTVISKAQIIVIKMIGHSGKSSGSELSPVWEAFFIFQMFTWSTQYPSIQNLVCLF